MSTYIHDQNLYTDIYKKEDLVRLLEEQTESVRRQIEAGSDLIEFHFCSVEIDLDYDEKELSIGV